MRKLHKDGYDVADNLLAAFAGAGYLLTPDTRILDVGCGKGGLVYRLRDLGYQAYGFDIRDRVEYRDPADAQYFGFIENQNPDTSTYVVEADDFRMPFDDDTFDVVVSTSVLEHVMDLDSFMCETARVLKPEGFGYHLYPNTSVIIEPHVYIPFASRLHARWYLYLWALMGVRRPSQREMGAAETTRDNATYFRQGLVYRSRNAIAGAAGRHFGVVRFVDDVYYPGIKPSVFMSNRMKALFSQGTLNERLIAASYSLKMGSLMTESKRTDI